MLVSSPSYPSGSTAAPAPTPAAAAKSAASANPTRTPSPAADAGTIVLARSTIPAGANGILLVGAGDVNPAASAIPSAPLQGPSDVGALTWAGAHTSASAAGPAAAAVTGPICRAAAACRCSCIAACVAGPRAKGSVAALSVS